MADAIKGGASKIDHKLLIPTSDATPLLYNRCVDLSAIGGAFTVPRQFESVVIRARLFNLIERTSSKASAIYFLNKQDLVKVCAIERNGNKNTVWQNLVFQQTTFQACTISKACSLSLPPPPFPLP